MALLIEDMGGKARVAYDGDSAVAMLQEYTPEISLLDIGMRSPDGYETCQRIRSVLGSGVVLVALTGFGQELQTGRPWRGWWRLACQAD